MPRSINPAVEAPASLTFEHMVLRIQILRTVFESPICMREYIISSRLCTGYPQSLVQF